MRNILNSEIKNERYNAAALGAYSASVGTDYISEKAKLLAERSFDEFIKMSDPAMAIKNVEKQYLERKVALLGTNVKDEYIIATELLYKKLGRELPKDTKSQKYNQSLENQLKNSSPKGVQDFIHQTAKNIRSYEDAIKSKEYSKERKASFRKLLNAENKRMDLVNKIHFSGNSK